jgi:hypothetical protein
MATVARRWTTIRTLWRPGARVERLRASHSYGFVLALVVILFLFVAFAPDEEWSRSVIVLLEAALVIAALWTSGLWRDRRVAVVLAGVGVVAALMQLLVGGDTPNGLIALLEVLLLFSAVITIAVGVLDQRDVNAQSVLGAVSIYLLLGMFFVFVYGAAADLGSGPFFAQATDGTLATRLYFSYVTLATLGYGDYTPAGDFGRAAAVTEALLGQLYLVTVIALIVGRLTAAAVRNRGN